MKRKRKEADSAGPDSHGADADSENSIDEEEYFEGLSSRFSVDVNLPKIVEPTTALPADLERLYLMLQRQGGEDNSVLFEEFEADEEPMQRLRDFENLAFRLALDEGREMRRGRELEILGAQQQQQQQPPPPPPHQQQQS